MKKAFIVLIVILSSNVLSLLYGWYLRWNWFDITLHSLGGFFVAMFMASYLKDRLVSQINIKNILIVVGATLFVGVTWEFAEYIANQILIEPFYRWFSIRAYFIGDLQDTINDLLMDMLGALAFMSLYFFHKKQT